MKPDASYDDSITFKQLKESIEDRIVMLVHAHAHNDWIYGDDYISGELHGRLEETKVILDLINLVDAEREEKIEHSLRIVPSMTFTSPVVPDEDLDRHDPGRC